jgi:hypothetical protein
LSSEKYILDENGQPVVCDDLLEWASWYESSEKRRIAGTHLDGKDGVFISTVFLGLDHNFSPMSDPLTYKPILWETMIFGGKHDQFQRRYTSRELAELGHAEACAMAQQGIDEDAAALRELMQQCEKENLLDGVAEDAETQKNNENPHD